MPDKFNRPTEPPNALYHDVLCGKIESVREAIRETAELVRDQPVVAGAWSHGGRRCGAEDDVIACLYLLADAGADFSKLGAGTIDSAFKTFPRAARFLFVHGARATAASDDGTTGLHAMAAIGNRSAAAFLLDHGADIDSPASSGDTPLDLAARLALPRMVRFLKERGANSHVERVASRLEDPAQRQIERRDGDNVGEVAWYRVDRGYGYLRDYGEISQGGASNRVFGELFFDRDHLVGEEPASVEEGVLLTFKVGIDGFGLKAVEVCFGRGSR